MSRETRRVQKFFNEPSRTQQSFKDECDLNMTLSRFKKNCGVDFLSRYQGYCDGHFGDFSGVTDYRTALEQLQKAEEVFMSLPAKARAYFENSCALFLDALHDEGRVSELQEVGVLNKTPTLVESVSQDAKQ
ncbi:MAG: internal scaffolding protein [Microviridae sp.]|nr:MAG: internal scaffolding protein [Microviridae sp.]